MEKCLPLNLFCHNKGKRNEQLFLYLITSSSVQWAGVYPNASYLRYDKLV